MLSLSSSLGAAGLLLFLVAGRGVQAQTTGTECAFETHPTTLSMVVGGSGSSSRPCFFLIQAPPTDQHVIEFVNPGNFYLTSSPSQAQAKLGCNQGGCDGAIIRFSKADASSYEPEDEFMITWSKQTLGACTIRIRPGNECISASGGNGQTRFGNLNGFRGDDSVKFNNLQYVDGAVQVELVEGNTQTNDVGRVAASNIGCVVCNEMDQATHNPTESPTAGPTASPSASPTTAGPTLSPTVRPTADPTLSPTFRPTAGPTLSPTVRPTAGPTAGPTVAPTAGPTAFPTISPTTDPTAAPTLSPTTIAECRHGCQKTYVDSIPTCPKGPDRRDCMHNLQDIRDKCKADCS